MSTNAKRSIELRISAAYPVASELEQLWLSEVPFLFVDDRGDKYPVKVIRRDMEASPAPMLTYWLVETDATGEAMPTVRFAWADELASGKDKP